MSGHAVAERGHLESLSEDRSGQRHLGCQRAARIIEKRTYANANEVVEAFEENVPVETAKALTALHVVYGDNRRVVKAELALLWDYAQPEWAVLTTPNVGAKLEMAKGIAPFSVGRFSDSGTVADRKVPSAHQTQTGDPE